MVPLGYSVLSFTFYKHFERFEWNVHSCYLNTWKDNRKRFMILKIERFHWCSKLIYQLNKDTILTQNYVICIALDFTGIVVKFSSWMQVQYRYRSVVAWKLFRIERQEEYVNVKKLAQLINGHSDACSYEIVANLP